MNPRATFALIHGGGSTAWDWHLVLPILARAGHSPIAVDLPIDDDGADLDDYARTVAAVVGSARDVIVVGHSLGGFTAPLVCDKVDAIGLVYLAAMIPAPGESFTDWWANTGYDEDVDDSAFFTGVPDDLAREARSREREQRGEWMSRPWPAPRHPLVPTRVLLCRDDAFFPAPFQRRQARERLGLEPVEISGGHYAALGAPQAVATALLDFAGELGRLPRGD
ncbi:alpha/beta hydrolase [Mycetocola sp. 2940]|uniref:alpha/beta fold hydrolase n=1 Tax=Mycetocola sp. 2940 TaxID=3156452 RepID=UPI003397E603